jgi:hypothetical protein
VSVQFGGPRPGASCACLQIRPAGGVWVRQDHAAVVHSGAAATQHRRDLGLGGQAGNQRVWSTGETSGVHAPGDRIVRGVLNQGDHDVLRLDLRDGVARDQREVTVSPQLLGPAEPEPSGEEPQWRTTEEGVFRCGSDARPRALDPRRADCRSGPSAPSEHLEPSGPDNEGWQQDCHHHHALHRRGATSAHGKSLGTAGTWLIVGF